MLGPRIAIIGGGPGGLTLACLLQRHGMHCTVFELEMDRWSRTQGGSIDLHSDSGQLALHEAGLLDEFQKHVVPAVEAMKLMKKDGSVHWDENMADKIGLGSRNRPEIDRAKLRDILLDAIEPNTIQWNRRLIRVESADDSRYHLHFANTVESGFDLVVGADGAWSKVRPLLTDQSPFYSGVTVVELQAKSVSTNKPWLAKFTGSGSLFMFDEGRAITCQNNSDDSVRVYAALRQPETWREECDINWTQQDVARQTLVDHYFADCHDDLKRAVALEASDDLVVRPLYMLPVGFEWTSRPGVTLIGDAAHLMTPFAGVGVNVALADALGLATALLKRRDGFQTDLHGSLADAIQEYEGPMFERAAENMEKSWMGLQNHFSADGIEQRVKRLHRMIQKAEEAKKAREMKQREVPQRVVNRA